MARWSPILNLALLLGLLLPTKALAERSKLSANNNDSPSFAEKSPAPPVARPSKRRRQRPAPPPIRRKFYQLKAGPGYRLQDPHHAWGTFTTVMALQEVLSQYHRKYPDPAELVIHDLSRKRGGKIRPHVSHRSGRDVDIRLPLNQPGQKYVDARPSTLDVERTWYLISAMLQTKTVEYIFLDSTLQRALYHFALTQEFKRDELREIFQYPGHHRQGIVRHEPGHKGHMHVRFLRQRAAPQDLVM